LTIRPVAGYASAVPLQIIIGVISGMASVA
jgi:hypothetical protein